MANAIGRILLLLNVTLGSAVFFQEAGKLHLFSSKVRVAFSIDLRVFPDQCHGLVHNVTFFEEVNKNIGDCQWIPLWAAEARQHAEDICAEIAAWPQLISDRVKRQVWAIAGTIGAFTAWAGNELLHHFLHNGIDNKLQATNQRVRQLAKTVNQILAEEQKEAQWETRYRTAQELRTSMILFETHTSKVSLGLQTLATSGKLTSALLASDQAEDVWQRIHQLAIQHGLELSLPVSAIYELPVTLTQNGSFVYSVELEVPLSSTPAQLYHLLDFPIQLPGHEAYFHFHSDEVLAVSADSTLFWIFSWQQLHACHKIHHHHFCQDRTSRADFEGHCLTILYHGRWNQAPARCELHKWSVPWALASVDAENYHLFVNESVTYKEICPNQPVQTGVWQTGIQAFQVPQDCRIDSPLFKVAPEMTLQYHGTLHINNTWNAEIGLRLGQEAEKLDVSCPSSDAVLFWPLICAISLATFLLVMWFLYVGYLFLRAWSGLRQGGV